MKRNVFYRWVLSAAAAVGCAVLFPVKGQETNSDFERLTLDAAMGVALESNPEIRILSAHIAAARGEVLTAGTWNNPEVSMAPGFKNRSDPSTTEFHGDFGLEQTLEWPGKRAL